MAADHPDANRPAVADEREEPLVVDARAYWFNDMDYHGVLADPFFRYSIRVDGVFSPGFVETLRDGTADIDEMLAQIERGYGQALR